MSQEQLFEAAHQQIEKALSELRAEGISVGPMLRLTVTPPGSRKEQKEMGK